MARSFHLLLVPGRILLLAFLFSVTTAAAIGQTQKPVAVKPVGDDIAAVRSSPAYAELALRRTELQSEVEALVLQYTEEYPKLKEVRYALTLVERDLARLGKVKSVDAAKLTLALGKLMVRRIELETDLWKLQDTYKDEHPDVKRAKRRVEIYETSINEILN